VRILVTGGAGYLGSILVPELLADGHRVDVLDNLMHRQTSLCHVFNDERFRFVCGDARDKSVLAPLLAKADVLIPLAAIVGMPACEADKTAAWSTNSQAVGSAIGLMSPEQRIIIPITNSGYGVGSTGECTEDSPLKPISYYGKTKVEAEHNVLDRGNAISLRLATVFGMSPRMRLDLLVNDFVDRAMRDRALILFEPHFRRNYIHVRDVATAFLHAIDNFDLMRDRPYNVGLSSANLSKLALCQKIREHVPGFVFLTAPVGEDPDKRDYIVSNARIEATGWRPQHTLDMGIAELIRGLPMIRNREHRNA
jgi:nucleoside-diphosphate-sugar epimerase